MEFAKTQEGAPCVRKYWAFLCDATPPNRERPWKIENGFSFSFGRSFFNVYESRPKFVRAARMASERFDGGCRRTTRTVARIAFSNAEKIDRRARGIPEAFWTAPTVRLRFRRTRVLHSHVPETRMTSVGKNRDFFCFFFFLFVSLYRRDRGLGGLRFDNRRTRGERFDSFRNLTIARIVRFGLLSRFAPMTGFRFPAVFCLPTLL